MKSAVVPSPLNILVDAITPPPAPELTVPGIHLAELLFHSKAWPSSGATEIVFTSYNVLSDKLPVVIVLFPSFRI